jgi:class 3 adenylate cyclase/protein-S-isoprenylcysteine O-methyltransferase Ste14
MDPNGVERKLAAILSADVAGYGRLMAEGEVKAVRTLTAYLAEMARLVGAHRGRVVDSPGDNLLGEFPSALDATRCAVEMQRVLQARNADLPEPKRMYFRIGVHLGEVMVTGDRIYGDGVDIAARLEGLAEPGGICISASVYDPIRRKLQLSFEDLGEQRVQNLLEPVRAYRARVSGAAARVRRDDARVLPGLSGRPSLSVLVAPAVWLVYVAIVFEILFMISPFALYYYSAYGPSLNFFQRSPWTVWLTDFFLPHFSRTSSPVLNALPGLGRILVLLGAVVFFVGFFQVYWAKIRRRGVVSRGLYAFSRHPQYLGLAIVGLGTLLVWPRFLVLIMYITMLLLYGLLARWEEQRCLKKFGESYRAYRGRGGLLGKLPRLLPASGGKRFAAVLVLYLVVILATVALGYRLRDYSLSQLSALYTENMAVLSPAVLGDDELRTALRVALADAEIRGKIRAAAKSEKLLVYVVPLELSIGDLPMETHRHVGPPGHHLSDDFDRRFYKVLFTKVRTYDPAVQGEEIVKQAYGRDPIVLVKVNTETGRIMGIETPPAHVRWGDIPTPLF